MLKHNMAFFTVVYPSAESFFEDHVESIKKQTVTNFDYYIFNDGLATDTLLALLACLNGIVNWYVIDVTGTPAEIRVYAINYLSAKKYTHAISGDSDDYFSKNRVEVIAHQFKNFDVVINDLDIVNSSGKLSRKGYLSKRFPDQMEICIQDLEQKNFCGFSNSAFKLAPTRHLQIDKDVIATDWYLFTVFLLSNMKMVFCSGATTYYRQHAENYVGFGYVNEEKLRHAIDVKLEHYKALADQGSSYSLQVEIYRKLKQRIEKTDFQVYKNVRIKDDSLWWEIDFIG